MGGGDGRVTRLADIDIGHGGCGSHLGTCRKAVVRIALDRVARLGFVCFHVDSSRVVSIISIGVYRSGLDRIISVNNGAAGGTGVAGMILMVVDAVFSSLVGTSARNGGLATV